ncbi:MAG TPA: hypothetical protein VK437_10200 [Steroidobacteraceae bacterium]|nr:hypothetical protein [Steroidobacteraceae bacterium]
MVSGDLQIWLNHFEYHAEHPRRVLHGGRDVLWPHERRRIASSIATLQLGEESAGRRLERAAQRCAHENRIALLARILELLAREEQRHAQLLETFMADHRIPIKRAGWTDWVFRRVRGRAGLELYLYVLTSAELIGIVCYRALESVTGCRRLQLLCRTLVADELAHVGFESQLLVTLRVGRAAPIRALIRWAHWVFFASTALVVWLTHRAALRHARYSGRSFVRACLAQYAFYLGPASAALASIPLARPTPTK